MPIWIFFLWYHKTSTECTIDANYCFHRPKAYSIVIVHPYDGSYGRARCPSICRHSLYPFGIEKRYMGALCRFASQSLSLDEPALRHLSSPLYSCVRPFYVFPFSFFAYYTIVENQMKAPTPYNPRETYQACVYPEARCLPDDVARRTLLPFFFVDPFDVSRTTICFNDTPARACKQLAEPERRTFDFFHPSPFLIVSYTLLSLSLSLSLTLLFF